MFDWLCRLFMLVDRLFRPLRHSEPPASQQDSFSTLVWLEADQNPFGLRVLDCRPIATTFLSTTEDPAIATQFGKLRDSLGEHHRGQLPYEPVAVPCELTYPFGGEARDGPLFIAQRMEDKWDIYLYDGYLYFARSWTGELGYRARVEFQERAAVVSAIDVSRTRLMNEPPLAIRTVDFLIKTHLHRREAPHPLPAWFPQDKKLIGLHTFKEFGCWGWYASFEDTTKVRVPEVDGGKPGSDIGARN